VRDFITRVVMLRLLVGVGAVVSGPGVIYMHSNTRGGTLLRTRGATSWYPSTVVIIYMIVTIVSRVHVRASMSVVQVILAHVFITRKTRVPKHRQTTRLRTRTLNMLSFESTCIWTGLRIIPTKF
jgi:hypothetical protein